MYDNRSDEELVTALHRKFYSNMPIEQFSQQIGYVPAETNAETEEYSDPIDTRLRAAGQGGWKGIGNFLGMPVDLVTMGLNALGAGLNEAGEAAGIDARVPTIKKPFMGSDWLADRGEDAADAIGHRVMDPNGMTTAEKIFYRSGSFVNENALGAGTVSAATKAAPALKQALTPLDDVAAGTLGRSTVAAGGAGASVGAYEGSGAEKAVQENLGPAASALGGILAAVAGGAGADVARGAVTAGVKSAGGGPSVMDVVGVDKDVSARGYDVSKKTADTAAARIQADATNPQSAAQQIRDGMAEADLDQPLPTSALLTDDVGLIASDKGQRLQHAAVAKEAMVRDTAVRDYASGKIDELKPAGADKTLPGQMVADEKAARLAEASGVSDRASAELAKQEQLNADGTAKFRSEAGDNLEASEALDRELVEGAYKPATAHKNELFRQIDPNGEEMVSTEGMKEVAASVKGDSKALPPSLRERRSPGPILNEIKKGKDEISIKDLNDMRPGLSESAAEARKDGMFQKANGFDRLRKGIDDEIENLADNNSDAGLRAEQALKNYKDDYAPLYRNGTTSEFFTSVSRDVDRRNTPRSATGRVFWHDQKGGPEAAKELAQIVASAPDQASAREAARRYILADIARSVPNSTKGVIQDNILQTYLQRRAQMFKHFPEIEAEVKGLLADVRSGKAKASALAADLKSAQNAMKMTERDVNKGVFAIFADKNPENAVKSLMSSGDPLASVRELKKTIGQNERAVRGLQASVADWLTEKVKGVSGAGVTENNQPVNLAAVTKLMRQHEPVLREIYGDKIVSIKKAQKALHQLSRRSVQSVPGSGTVENGVLRGRGQDVLESFFRLKYGALKGGTVMRVVRRGLDIAFPNYDPAGDLLAKSMFDPALAAHLLERSVDEVGSPKWNRKLYRLMSWTGATRATNEGNEDANSSTD